jgi:hypothetical protein
MRTIEDNILLIFLGSKSTRSIYLYTKGSRRLNKMVEANSGGKLMEWRSGSDMRSGGVFVEAWRWRSHVIEVVSTTCDTRFTPCFRPVFEFSAREKPEPDLKKTK